MMTNSCYSPRVYDRYRVGADPVKLNQQFYCRKRIIRNRLLHKGRLYWTGYDILHKIHEIYRTMDDMAQYRIHRIMHFMRRSVKVFYSCAMIALIN